MNQEEQQQNQGVQPQDIQLNTKTQFYADDLNQSKVHSVVSHSSSPQNLLKFFQQYNPTNKFLQMDKLHTSSTLKLKKYKQSIYYGDFVNGKRKGKGIMVYDNNRVYEGDWEDDYKHGHGYEKFPNQCSYEGEYVNGKPQGIGKYSWINGQFYEGEWLNGQKNGSGMWRGAKGDSYIGQWKLGKADGYGVHTWVNGDRYQGQFKQCLKHGQGIQKFANGDIYKGMYMNGKPSGFGQYYWANGSYFKGVFKDGLRHGQGIWKRTSGNSDKYEGQYINDKKHGYGIFTWATGNIYKGNYQLDMRCGYGQMYWNDGSFYKGQWKNGIQHGQGEIYVPGEGFKKGLFEQNVLVIVQKQSAIVEDPNHYLRHLNEQDPQKDIMRKSKMNKHSISPNKLNFRNKLGYLSKNKPKESRQVRSIDENIVVRYGMNKQSNSLQSQNYGRNHPLLPQKFNRREQKYLTMQRRNLKPKPQQKQRILHSSFYMHKIHNRATTSINGSRAEVQSGYCGSEQFSRNNYQQMRFTNKNKMAKEFKTPQL